jgi:hypothetical protein
MSARQVFPSWWQALAAVPPSKTARDWWANGDERSPRYDRLYRVWGDPTDSVPPPYFKIEKEKHLVTTLWENFALFAPKDSIAAIYRELQFQSPGPALDLCWSYEFNLGHQDRQLDIVMHVRFADHDEIVIGEAKAGRKRFDDKDLAPHNVLSRQVFNSVPRKLYFLLGDASPPADWSSRGFRHITWVRLAMIQADLCESLPEPPPVKSFIRQLILAQFAGHGIAVAIDGSPEAMPALKLKATSLLSGPGTERCRNFIDCAIQHLCCLNDLPTNAVPISYLDAEPKVEQIQRRWRLGCGGRAVNEKPYWRLPARLA